MLGVGWTEMLVIGVVALIVIGPKELPAVMHRLGKFTATIRRMGADFQRELNKTTGLNEITNLRNSVTAPLKATADAIRKEFNTTTPTGQVQPSGVLKPADPASESVVDEIKAAAGMTTPAAAPAAIITPAPAVAAEPAAATPPAKARVRAARPARIKAPSDTPVAVTDMPPASKPVRKPRKPIESPAPVEALAPAPEPAIAKPPRSRTPRTPKVAEADPTLAPAVKRSRKPGPATES